MKAKDLHVSTLKIVQLDYVSTFLSLFFVSSISVDLYKGYGISKEVMTVDDAVSSILADRLVSLFALFFLSVAGVLIFHDLIGNRSLIYIVLILPALLAAGTFLLFNERLSVSLKRYEAWINRFKVLKKIVALREALVYYKAFRFSLLSVFMLSLVIQVSRILIYYLAALALRNQLPLAFFFAYVPLIVIIIMLPISFAGIGVREGSFIYFFTGLGVSQETAFAISFLVSLSVLITLLPGGLIYAFKGLVIKNDTLYKKVSGRTNTNL